MLKLGKFNELEVIRKKDFGVFLHSDVGEILLPKKYIENKLEIGDKVDVFVYKDSEDRYIATTLKPKAQVDEFALLQVKDSNNVGAFLDWGLEKDLLVPFSQQSQELEVGKKYLVKVYLDKVSNRIIASEKINKFLDNEEITVNEKDEVDLIVHKFLDLGVGVIVNQKHYGLIFKNEIYKELKVGDILRGYVKKVREDNKLDISIRKGIVDEIDESKERILKELEKENGFLNLNDKSSAEDIKQKLEMSKNLFKKSIGGLYKSGIIELKNDGIALK